LQHKFNKTNLAPWKSFLIRESTAEAALNLESNFAGLSTFGGVNLEMFIFPKCQMKVKHVYFWEQLKECLFKNFNYRFWQLYDSKCQLDLCFEASQSAFDLCVPASNSISRQPAESDK